jgi:membrane protein required for colicin V production
MIVDIAVGIIVLISAAIAFLRGFIREVLTIAGVVGGVLAAIFLGPKLAPVFRGWFGVENGEKVEKLFDIVPMDVAADATAYAAIFIIFVIAISVLSHFIASGVKAMGLGPIDRTLGVIFGVVRGFVLLGLFYLPFHLMMKEESKEELFADSRTHYLIEDVAEILTALLPDSEDVESVAKEKQDDFRNTLLKQNLLPSTGTEPVAEEKPKEGGYNNQERGEIDALFGGTPTDNE